MKRLRHRRIRQVYRYLPISSTLEAPYIQPLHDGHDLDGQVASFGVP